MAEKILTIEDTVMPDSAQTSIVLPAVIETESNMQAPQAQCEPSTVMSDEAVLAYTQQVRMGVVGQLLSDGRLPDDKSDKALLTQTLDGLDRQALGRMKIQVEADANNQLANATTMINELLNTVKTDIFTAAIPVQRTLPELPIETVVIVEERLVVGELDSGYREETVDEFKARYDAENGDD